MKGPLLILAAVLLLSGCMAPPARRETGLDSSQACRAQCNREHQVCLDQESAGRSGVGGGIAGMGATCQRELEMCLPRCGMSR